MQTDSTFSTSGPGTPPPSPAREIAVSSEQLATPLTESERAESWKQLSELHPGNRLRLMFGLPLLDEQ